MAQTSYFYPRSPCGERQIADRIYLHSRAISIHALLAESDKCESLNETADTQFLSTLSLRRATYLSRFLLRLLEFLSTLSLRRATNFFDNICHICEISIHALLAESDYRRWQMHSVCLQFLSTLSLRRATCGPLVVSVPVADFYPRSPCGERPQGESSKRNGRANFYPRSPCGERQAGAGRAL